LYATTFAQDTFSSNMALGGGRAVDRKGEGPCHLCLYAEHVGRRQAYSEVGLVELDITRRSPAYVPV
jgi:hypothetical protein